MGTHSVEGTSEDMSDQQAPPCSEAKGSEGRAVERPKGTERRQGVNEMKWREPRAVNDE